MRDHFYLILKKPSPWAVVLLCLLCLIVFRRKGTKKQTSLAADWEKVPFHLFFRRKNPSCLWGNLFFNLWLLE